MGKYSKPVRVAIACQGGGAHTAFTAGVLDRILADDRQSFEIVSLSGTSGGAVCALFAWYGLSQKNPAIAQKLLKDFWAENSANSLLEKLWNISALSVVRSPIEVKVSPYFPGLYWGMTQVRLQSELLQKLLGFGEGQQLSPWSTFFRSELEKFTLRPEFIDLQQLLEQHIDFDSLPDISEGPQLLVGAVEVCTGQFKAFDSRKERILSEMILASAALPSLVKAVHVNDGVYWDGLFSQNPPIREFVCGVERAEKPDQIWVIQINPREREKEPTSVEEILDRRNELSGNVSLQQEINSIETLNKVARAAEDLFATHPEISDSSAGKPLRKYKQVKICRIEIDESKLFPGRTSGLDYASKLDRSPQFIQQLVEHGQSQAQSFLNGWSGKSDNI